jgi:hypothetical protein
VAYVRAVVARYRGKIDTWVCASRVNTADALSLAEDEHLRLAARVCELIRSLDPKAAVILSFDQPWAEYLSSQERDFPPEQLADALIRAGLGLAGVMLEINVGYCSGGTLPRDPLEFSRRLDHWATLGLPVHVAISAPSGLGEDPLSRRQGHTRSNHWTPATQQRWITRFVPLMLAKSYVQGIVWNQLRDSQPHDFPHGGLFDASERAKPAIRTLGEIRRAHLEAEP